MSNESYKSIIEPGDIKVAFSGINHSYGEYLASLSGNKNDIDINGDEEIIYECACGALWDTKDELLFEADYVFAIYNAKIVGIYPVDKNSWTPRSELETKYKLENSDSSDNRLLFPRYPLVQREKEYKYSVALTDCIGKWHDTVWDGENIIKVYLGENGLSFDELMSVINHNKEESENESGENPIRKIKRWYERYFFTKNDEKCIPESFNEFFGGKPRFISENENGEITDKQRNINNLFTYDKDGIRPFHIVKE